jgi:hypothetical protein
VLCALFPTQYKLLSGKENWGHSEPYFKLVNRRSIACESVFDAYFQLFLQPDAISATDLDLAMERLADRGFMREQLRSYMERNDRGGASLVGEYMRNLQFRMMGREGFKPPKEVLQALLDVGGDIQAIERHGGMLVFPPRVQMSLLIRDVLRLWGPEVSHDNLTTIFEESVAVSLLAAIFCDRARELGELPSHGSREEPAISKATLEKLGETLLPKIRVEAAAGSLQSAPIYFEILWAWNYLGTEGEAKRWLSGAATESSEVLAKAGLGMLGFSLDEDSRAYSMSERPDEAIFDFDALRQAAERHRVDESLSVDHRKRVEAIYRGLERIAAADEEQRVSDNAE